MTPPSASSADAQGRAVVVVEAASATATVQSVDPAQRVVVLKHADGRLSSYECGPQVRNFDQIKPGDKVTATVAEESAIALVKGGVAPSADSTAVLARAPQGAKPAVHIAKTTGLTAKVLGVDLVKREVTLQPAGGEKRTIKVAPEIDLAAVKPGDDVMVRVTRAFAVTVTPP